MVLAVSQNFLSALYYLLPYTTIKWCVTLGNRLDNICKEFHPSPREYFYYKRIVMFVPFLQFASMLALSCVL